MLKIDRKALAALYLFTADEDIRYYLKGVHVQCVPGRVRLEATDGHHMAVFTDRSETAGTIKSLIIPNDTVKSVLSWKLPRHADGLLTLAPADGGQWALSGWQQSAAFTPIDGQFPDCRRVIPLAMSGKTAQFNPAYLSNCNQAFAILTDLPKKSLPKTQLHHNGDGAAVVSGMDSRLCCVVMPLRLPPDALPDVAGVSKTARDDLQAVAPEETTGEPT